jgi:hypothetical protein
VTDAGVLGGKRSWAELEVLPHESGRLTVPCELRKRGPDGKVTATKVRVWAPTPEDHLKARVEAVGKFTKAKLDRVVDKDMFEQVEQLELLARCIRTFEAPFGQFVDTEELARYDEGSLHDIQERVNRFKEELDPRESVTTEEQFWKVLFQIAKLESAAPLADIVGHEQPSCVVRMALEACSSPRAQPWLQSLGISIPGPSPSQSSSE